MHDFHKIDLGDGATLIFVQGDITRQATDAIVNAANSTLLGGGGVDGAIHRAGGPAILEECKKIVAEHGHLPPGEAVSTTVWRGGLHGEAGLLANAYRNSLRLADRLGLHSVAFPAISTGAYGYPAAEAAGLAIESVVDALAGARHAREARFVLFDHAALEVFLDAARAVAHRRKANWHLEHITGVCGIKQ
jgi:O-acetyl-ADP-ribose deacetylase (regulator of RNase III)